MAQRGSGTPLTRVTEVVLTGYRGWSRKQRFSTDADIVLLTGSNGLGKSSFLEAVAWLLNGWQANQPAGDEGGRGLERLVNVGPTDCRRFCFSLKGTPDYFLEFSSDSGSKRTQGGVEVSFSKGFQADLSAAGSSFFQDRPRFVLDERRRNGRLAEFMIREELRDFVDSLDPIALSDEACADVEQRFNSARTELEQAKEEVRSGNEGITELIAGLLGEDTLVEKLREVKEDLDSVLSMNEEDVPGAVADQTLRIEQLRREVEVWMKARENEIKNLLSVLKSEVPAIPGKEHEEKEKGTSSKEPSGVQARFGKVAQYLQDDSARIRERGATAEATFQEIAEWLRKLKEKYEDYENARQSEKECWNRKIRCREFLDLVSDYVRKYANRHDEGVETQLSNVLNRVLLRFLPTPGVFPVRANLSHDDRSHWTRLETKDKRSWSVLSTGQKAQLSLAWMMAQALVLRTWLPHRVLILDDTSSAFDLGNLARQATWLRQLAYTDDDEFRWQIFLASHHDEMTTRLVELLHPPPGRSLLVLDFVGWTPEVGPEVVSHELRPGPVSSTLGMQEALQRAWHRPPGGSFP